MRDTAFYEMSITEAPWRKSTSADLKRGSGSKGRPDFIPQVQSLARNVQIPGVLGIYYLIDSVPGSRCRRRGGRGTRGESEVEQAEGSERAEEDRE